MIEYGEFYSMSGLNNWFDTTLGGDRSRIISIETMPNGYYKVWYYRRT